MSLDRRLTLLFLLIVVFPLLAAGFILERVVEDQIRRRAILSLEPTLSIALDVHSERMTRAETLVPGIAESPRTAKLLAAGRASELTQYLTLRAQRGHLDFLVATANDGSVVASRVTEPTFLPGQQPPSAEEIARVPSTVQDGYATTEAAPVKSDGEEVGRLVGGAWIDDDVLIGSTSNRVELGVVADGRLIAATRDLTGAVVVSEPAEGRFTLDAAGGGPAVAEAIGDDTALVAWVPATPLRELVGRIVAPLGLLLLVAVVWTAVMGWVLSRWITRPIVVLSQRARALAEGRFDERITLRASGEVGQLATSFNEMSERLSDMVQQLSSSREQMRRAVRRVGETLRSTHNMQQILESLLNTASDAVQADAAVLWRFAPNRRELYAAISCGVEDELGNLPVGSGIAGLVAERGGPVSRAGQGPEAVGGREPRFPVAAGAPIYSGGRIQGVVVVYREDPTRAFTEEDLETVVFLAEQGGVAIENVTLHEEAQRLSLTDGLTGVWNRRFFQMHFRQTLATSVRFERPFSVLMMDLDHFKRVNDSHGHRRGDAILVEFARRVNNVLREVDTFARYGGEEFVCLLSETDHAGAVTTAGKIQDVINAEPFGEPGEEPVRLTVSVGVASYPRNGASFSSLIEAADQALYEAKQAGRDRVVVAGGAPSLSVAK